MPQTEISQRHKGQPDCRVSFQYSFTLLTLSMTLMGFESNPSLAKVTLLEKQTKILKGNRVCENLMIYMNIYVVEELY